jgi:hypothetical protein
MAVSAIVPAARNRSLYLLLATRLARALRPIQLDRIVQRSRVLTREGGKLSSRLPPEPLYSALGGGDEHRRKVQQAADERAAERDSELESQASPMKDPQERIRIWERLHALRLPKAPGHVLVKVIAKQTGLTVGQVHEEQQRRAAPLSPSPQVS